jgi:HK97 family phage major capsid protein
LLKRKDIMSIQALREQLSHHNREAKALLEANGDRAWSKEDQAKYDGLMDKAEGLTAQIKAHQRMLDAEAEANFSDAKRAVGKGAAAGKNGEIDALQAVSLYLRHGGNVSAEQAVAIRNAMSTTTGLEGGFTVPTEVAKMVLDALKAYGGMRELADVITTEGGNDWQFPASDGTAEEGEIVGQNAPATQGEITFSQVPLVVYKFSSKKLALPWELIQDSGIDVVAFVVNRLAQRIARIENRMFTTGTGTGQPFGLMTRATLGKTGTTGQTVTVIYDDLVDLEHSVNRAYRRDALFTMNDLSVRQVRKIKDTQGRPIFDPGYEISSPAGAPARLMGYPLITNDDVAVMAANARSIGFGPGKQYVIRDVVGVDIRRFDDSAFALNGQVGFCGWQRAGGNLLDPASFKYYANSAT